MKSLRFCLYLVMFGLFAHDGYAESAQTMPSADQEVEQGEATAVFAAGCFWCVEQAFDEVDGVTGTTSGFTGGDVRDPGYKQVSGGGTGHTEAVQVTFDPGQVSYEQLLDVFWHNVDPTDAAGQFCDRGNQYRSGIFYVNESQKKAAIASKQSLENDPEAPSPIVVEITQAGPFYAAERYHQNYYKKNPVRYRFYKTACGRKARLKELWK